MMEPEADRYRDPAAVARCARVAARVFQRHNVDFSTAQREGGWTNATWSAGRLVLRVAVQESTEHLRREAWLASLLPPEVGYPPIVETGVREGTEWMLTKRVAECNLDDVWPTLGWEARAAALDQLWAKAQAIHSVDPDLAKAIVRDQTLFYAPNATKASEQLARLNKVGVLSSNQATVLATVLDRFWPALRCAPGPAPTRPAGKRARSRPALRWAKHSGQVCSCPPTSPTMDRSALCVTSPRSENWCRP